MDSMSKIRKSKKFICIIAFMLCFTSVFASQGARSANATTKMPGYENPNDIIIATPANGYSTYSSKVSILGACDYNYPLYMNGEEVETTEYGFFTVYVELSVGDNTFEFENGDNMKTLTITRKKKATNSNTTTSSGTKVTYKEYLNDVYGVVTAKYAMTRTKVSESDLSCMPLTRGTTFRILGEDGSYYKIADGTYVAKSSVTKYNKELEDNRITAAKISEKEVTNQVVTELSMNVNALYEVYFEGDNIYLTLYQTVVGKVPSVPKNTLIKNISITKNAKKKTITYCFELYDASKVLGYDILFNQGIMKFELKRGPKLTDDTSLKGTTVFLDAGHGQNDTGAVGPMGKFGPVEKDINLQITLYAKEYLENLGATVVLSRSDDTFYSLSDRVSMIRNLRPDISISIHGNSLDYSSDYSKTSGFITYYSYMLINNVAEQMNTSIASKLDLTLKPIRSKSLSLTRLTTCPALLLETSFLSHPEDYEYLIQAKNQLAFGEAIGKAIEEYLHDVAVATTTIYTVKKGDSLGSIAKKYGTTIEEIMKYNKIENKNYIYVGQKLEIPL